jgi:carbon storage regulator
MLVLSRKQSERIRLGKDIVVTVVRVSGDKVRLGIEAPSDMVVLRDELQSNQPTVQLLAVQPPTVTSQIATSQTMPSPAISLGNS